MGTAAGRHGCHVAGACHGDISTPSLHTADRVDAKMMSMREKRVIVDAAGRPAAGLQKKLISLKPAWQLFHGADFKHPVATIK